MERGAFNSPTGLGEDDAGFNNKRKQEKMNHERKKPAGSRGLRLVDAANVPRISKSRGILGRAQVDILEQAQQDLDSPDQSDPSLEMSDQVKELLAMDVDDEASGAVGDIHEVISRIEGALNEGLSEEERKALEERRDALQARAASISRKILIQSRKGSQQGSKADLASDSANVTKPVVVGGEVTDQNVVPTIDSLGSEEEPDLSRADFSDALQKNPRFTEAVEGSSSLIEIRARVAGTLEKIKGKNGLESSAELLELEEIERHLLEITEEEADIKKEVGRIEEELSTKKSGLKDILMKLGIKKDISGNHLEDQRSLAEDLRQRAEALESVRVERKELEARRQELLTLTKVDDADDQLAIESIKNEISTPTIEVAKDDLETRTLAAFEREFGLASEALNTVGEFANFSPQKKRLVLGNLRQLMRAQRAEEAEETFAAQRTANRSVAPEGVGALGAAKHSAINLWRGFRDGIMKPFKIAEQESNAAKQDREAARKFHNAIPEKYQSMLKLLVDTAAAGPEVQVETDAKGRDRIKPQYLDMRDVQFTDVQESQQALESFREAAQALSAVPREYSYIEASEEQKTKYQTAKENFDRAQACMLNLSYTDGEGKKQSLHTSPEMLSKVTQAEYQVEMQRLFDQYPQGEVENAMIEMVSVGKVKRVLRSFFRGAWTGLKEGSGNENTVYFTAGLLIRPAVAFGVGLAAAPAMGALFGRWRGLRKAKAELNAQDEGQRKNGRVEYDLVQQQVADVRAQLKALNEEKLKLETGGIQTGSALARDFQEKIDAITREELDPLLERRVEIRGQEKKEGRRNMVSSGDAERKLMRLVSDYESLGRKKSPSTEDLEKEAQLKARIQTRIRYTQGKLEEGLISFNGQESQEAPADGEGMSSSAMRSAIRAKQKIQLVTALEKARTAIVMDHGTFRYTAFGRSTKEERNRSSIDDSKHRLRAPKTVNGEEIAGPPELLAQRTFDWNTRAEERLKVQLKRLEEGINGIRDEKRKAMAWEGLKMGLAFGAAGTMVRFLAEHGFFTDEIQEAFHHAPQSLSNTSHASLLSESLLAQGGLRPGVDTTPFTGNPGEFTPDLGVNPNDHLALDGLGLGKEPLSTLSGAGLADGIHEQGIDSLQDAPNLLAAKPSAAPQWDLGMSKPGAFPSGAGLMSGEHAPHIGDVVPSKPSLPALEVGTGSGVHHHSIIAALPEHGKNPDKTFFEFAHKNHLTPAQIDQFRHMRDANITFNDDGSIRGITGHFSGRTHEAFAYGDHQASSAGVEASSAQPASLEDHISKAELADAKSDLARAPKAEELSRPQGGIVSAQGVHGRLQHPLGVGSNGHHAVVQGGGVHHIAEGGGVHHAHTVTSVEHPATVDAAVPQAESGTWSEIHQAHFEEAFRRNAGASWRKIYGDHLNDPNMSRLKSFNDLMSKKSYEQVLGGQQDKDALGLEAMTEEQKKALINYRIDMEKTFGKVEGRPGKWETVKGWHLRMQQELARRETLSDLQGASVEPLLDASPKVRVANELLPPIN
jgi:hypothetical protein